MTIQNPAAVLDRLPVAACVAPPWSDAQGSLCEIRMSQGGTELVLEPGSKGIEQRRIRDGIWDLRQRVYSRKFPDVNTLRNDPYDAQSCVIYACSPEGRVCATARIAFDGALGIPEAALVDRLVDGYRRDGIQFAELGRFMIDDEGRGLLNAFYRAYFELGATWGIQLYLMFVPDNKVTLYRRLMDAQVAISFRDLTFGGNHPYVCMEWWLDRTRPRFFSWSGASRSGDAAAVRVREEDAR
ncbi:N-acyl amino acid synthase FeeM domain-containing protein [Thiorhodococcus fuscus]|uniref:N-acyl amino acid synthase FeeM catalytic core domain-containing protein n=1 Tax=Thiorhodococcus fuscus TaxID=527200 RepID=A0ABW4Y3U0_9GAMM